MRNLLRIFIVCSLFVGSLWSQDSLLGNLDTLSFVDYQQMSDIELKDTRLGLVSLYFPDTSNQRDFEVDSLIRSVVMEQGLFEDCLQINTDLWNYSSGEICLADSCLEQYASAQELTHLMLWNIAEMDEQVNLSLILYDLGTFKVTGDSLFPLSIDQRVAEQEIKNAVGVILNPSQDQELTIYNRPNSWVKWFKDKENRLMVSSFGGVAIVTLIYLLSEEDELLPTGIGDPPTWPQP